MKHNHRTGVTLIELVVAMTVFATIASLALSLLVQTDKIALRGKNRLGQTLDQVALQEKLRNDIWTATDLHIEPDGTTARFTMPNGDSVTYSVSAGTTSRMANNALMTFPGSLEFALADRGLVAVVCTSPREWGFAARMRNQNSGDAQ